MTKPHGECYAENKRTSMSYKDFLKQRIDELEKEIQKSTGEKEALLSALNKLKLAEFEEDLRSEGESTQKLLKG